MRVSKMGGRRGKVKKSIETPAEVFEEFIRAQQDTSQRTVDGNDKAIKEYNTIRKNSKGRKRELQRDEREGDEGQGNGKRREEVGCNELMCTEEEERISEEKKKPLEDKIIVYKGKWRRQDKLSEEEVKDRERKNTRFTTNHRGAILLSAKLKEKSCTKNKRTNLLKIMSIIRKEKINIEKMFPKGFDSADIQFNNVYEANKCLDRYDLLKEDEKRIDIKVTNKNTRIKGVISDWDRDMPLEELTEAIDDCRGIAQIERMRHKKYNREEKNQSWVLGNNIIITFEGNNAPKDLSVWNNATRIRVRPFVENVKQCYNCFKFGHFSTYCKSKRCVICGDDYHGQCDKTEKCLNCDNKHRFDYKGCRNLNIIKS